MSKRVGSWASLAAMLLALLAGCGGDDDGDDTDKNGDKVAKPVAGTFVGRLGTGDAFVAVIAAPPEKGQKRREVSAFVCDAEQVCAWFSGSTSGNEFVAKSGAVEGSTSGSLRKKAATGSVTLPDGEKARYSVRAAPATAGVYDLTVSAAGKVRGASAAGVALTGQLTLPPPGDGNLKLADGTRLKLEVAEASGEDAAQLRPGQLRLIVLPDGQARGAGKSRGDATDFFVRSASK